MSKKVCAFIEIDSPIRSFLTIMKCTERELLILSINVSALEGIAATPNFVNLSLNTWERAENLFTDEYISQKLSNFTGAMKVFVKWILINVFLHSWFENNSTYLVVYSSIADIWTRGKKTVWNAIRISHKQQSYLTPVILKTNNNSSNGTCHRFLIFCSPSKQFFPARTFPQSFESNLSMTSKYNHPPSSDWIVSCLERYIRIAFTCKHIVKQRKKDSCKGPD